MATSSGSSPGTNGPLDVSNLVSQLIEVESKSRLAPLARKAEALNALISAYGALRLALGACQMALQEWDSPWLDTYQTALGNDAGSVTRVASGFVHAFNTLIKTMAELSRPAPSALRDKADGQDPLASDAMVPTLIAQLRDSVLAAAGGHANCSLATVGICFGRDDTLAVDATRLNAAADDNPQGLAAFFCAQDGLVPRALSLLSRLLHENGLLAGKTRALQISLKSVSDQQAATQERLACLRDSYISQFNRLNITLEKMQASQDQPGQQRRPLP
ncbi:flagellar filament capping protein FliD [Herbaspirillum sp. NPDC087042]|uniref:flagellar filament capping protein FliD n=1 Tax=Herbaspirillum sp. NPDC087042 TaxID=3364004 RepID=UPI0037FEB44B